MNNECKYCKEIKNYNNKDLYNHMDREMMYLKEDDDGKIKLFASVERQDFISEFSFTCLYCPKCGRKLTE